MTEKALEQRRWYLEAEKKLASLHRDLIIQQLFAENAGDEQLVEAIGQALWKLGGAIGHCAQQGRMAYPVVATCT